MCSNSVVNVWSGLLSPEIVMFQLYKHPNQNLPKLRFGGVQNSVQKFGNFSRRDHHR